MLLELVFPAFRQLTEFIPQLANQSKHDVLFVALDLHLIRIGEEIALQLIFHSFAFGKLAYESRHRFALRRRKLLRMPSELKPLRLIYAPKSREQLCNLLDAQPFGD